MPHLIYFIFPVIIFHFFVLNHMHRKQKDSYCHIKLDKWSEYFLFIINNIKLLTLKFEDVPRGAYRTGEKKKQNHN